MSSRKGGSYESVSSGGHHQWKEINKFLPSLNFDSDEKRYLPGTIPLPREGKTLDIFQADMLSHKHTGLKNYRSRKILAEEPYRTAIRKFYLALDGYLESSNPVQTGSQIIAKVCFSLDAADYFKKLKIKSFLETRQLILLEEPDWYEEHHWYPIKDIGDVFNYSYVPHITEETEDYLISEKPVNISQDYLDRFRRTVADILPDEGTFPIIDAREILLRSTSSSQYIPSSGVKGLTSENWKIKSQYLNFNSDPMKGKRCVIQVSPEGARDTIILPPNQVNTITWIERQVHAIIQEIPGNGMIDNQSQFMDEIHKLRSKYDHFLCRDFEKEGLTKPRVLLEIMLEEIGKKYPQLAIFNELKGIYSGYNLLVDNNFRSFPRGHGLGMANSLTTLMQIAIFTCVVNELSVEDMNESSECGFLAYNDDFVAGFNSSFFLESYWDNEGIFLEGLGLLRKATKSFKGDDFVFCEVYGKTMNRKESFLRREVLNALSCTSIVQAKELICSLRNGINPAILDEYIEEIVTYWGFEFTPKEINLPSIYAGWRGTRYKGIDYCFEETTVDFNYRALYEANKICNVRAPKRGSRGDYVNPLEMLFSITKDDIPSEYHSRFNFGTEREVSKNFNRMSLNPGHLAYLYKKCEEDRRNTYSEWLNKPQTGWVDLKDLIVSENPLVTFIDDSRHRVLCTQSQRERIRERMWFNSNPTLSFLKYHIPEKFQDDGIDKNPIPFLLKGPGFNRISSSQTDLVRNEYDYSNLRCKDDISAYEIELYEWDFFDKEDPHKYYLDPHVAAELALLRGKNYICRPWRNSPSPEIFKLRDEQYRLNTLKEVRIPKFIDYDDFQFLMTLPEPVFQPAIDQIYNLYYEYLKGKENTEKEIPVEEEKIPKTQKIEYDTVSDQYWAWVADPEKVRAYDFFHEVKDTLDYILSMTSSIPGADIERLLKTNDVEPRRFNTLILLLKFENTQVGEYRVPSFLVTTGFDGFESDESFGGCLFD